MRLELAEATTNLLRMTSPRIGLKDVISAARGDYHSSDVLSLFRASIHVVNGDQDSRNYFLNRYKVALIDRVRRNPDDQENIANYLGMIIMIIPNSEELSAFRKALVPILMDVLREEGAPEQDLDIFNLRNPRNIDLLSDILVSLGCMEEADKRDPDILNQKFFDEFIDKKVFHINGKPIFNIVNLGGRQVFINFSTLAIALHAHPESLEFPEDSYAGSYDVLYLNIAIAKLRNAKSAKEFNKLFVGCALNSKGMSLDEVFTEFLSYSSIFSPDIAKECAVLKHMKEIRDAKDQVERVSKLKENILLFLRKHPNIFIQTKPLENLLKKDVTSLPPEQEEMLYMQLSLYALLNCIFHDINYEKLSMGEESSSMLRDKMFKLQVIFFKIYDFPVDEMFTAIISQFLIIKAANSENIDFDKSVEEVMELAEKFSKEVVVSRDSVVSFFDKVKLSYKTLLPRGDILRTSERKDERRKEDRDSPHHRHGGGGSGGGPGDL